MNQSEIDRFKADMLKRGVQAHVLQGIFQYGPQNPNWVATTSSITAAGGYYHAPVTDLQIAGIDHRIRMIQERLTKPIEETVTE